MNWEIDKKGEVILIKCKHVGLTEGAITIPLDQIPIIKKAIIEWEMSK